MNHRIELEVLENNKVADAMVNHTGRIAWGTVTEAQPKRWAGRGGKLEIVMDSVRLIDGEKAALRATKEVKGGGYAGAMTAGIIASGVLFFPVAPLFLFIHGKDITIPKGTEISTFINGNFALDMEKFKPTASVQTTGETQANTCSEVAVTSTPAGADVGMEGAFVGSTRPRSPFRRENTPLRSRSRDSALGKEKSRFRAGTYKSQLSCKPAAQHKRSLVNKGPFQHCPCQT
jgi:hypothetical protein